ncbi:MAG: NAD(P)H-binding protein [Pseudomonadota bacterium]
MHQHTQDTHPSAGLTLVLGATGKTGSRIVASLRERGLPVREGSRSATPAFDWNLEAGWDAVLAGVETMYINYSPDLAIPGATESIRNLVKAAERHGVKRAVILSGRGEAEAQACEAIVMNSAMESTVVRASWFNQNFSEGAFIEMVHAGVIALPESKVLEPWVDVDDIADVVVAALTGHGHDGEIYEVTGPRLLSLNDVAEELSSATGREIRYVPIGHKDFVEGVAASGAPEDVVWIMDYLFSTVLDGRNAHVCDGVQRALGRAPRDFGAYARDVAATGVWESGESADERAALPAEPA